MAPVGNFAGDCGVPTSAGPALNLAIKALAPLGSPRSEISHKLHLCRRESGATQAPFADVPSGTRRRGRRVARLLRDTECRAAPPHLEEGGARPRRDVTAPGTGGGSPGGARAGATGGVAREEGEKKKTQQNPDHSHSREISSQPGSQLGLAPAPRIPQPGPERGALGLRREAGAGRAVRGGDPAGASEAGGKRPRGPRLKRAACAGADAARSLARSRLPACLAAGAAAEAGREQRREQRAAGGWRRLPAAPEPVPRRGRGAALSPPEPQHG